MGECLSGVEGENKGMKRTYSSLVCLLLLLLLLLLADSYYLILGSSAWELTETLLERKRWVESERERDRGIWRKKGGSVFLCTEKGPSIR